LGQFPFWDGVREFTNPCLGGQTDFMKVGYPFAWLFLPGANLIAYSMLLGYQLGGPKEAALVLTYPVGLTRHWLGV
jgi:hypothetical protein